VSFSFFHVLCLGFLVAVVPEQLTCPASRTKQCIVASCAIASVGGASCVSRLPAHLRSRHRYLPDVADRDVFPATVRPIHEHPRPMIPSAAAFVTVASALLSEHAGA